MKDTIKILPPVVYYEWPECYHADDAFERHLETSDLTEDRFLQTFLNNFT